MKSELLLEKLLCCALQKEYPDFLTALAEHPQPDFPVIKVCNETFLQAGAAVDAVYILLRGKCKVIVSNSGGSVMTADVMSAPQVFGLLEVILAQEHYTASVFACGECTVLPVRRRLFLELLEKNKSCYIPITHYFGYLAVRNMNTLEEQALLNKKEQFGIYLLNVCRGNPLPYRLREIRTETAANLHINLRTLFRYIEEFRAAGFIDSARGKIVISEDGCKKLQNWLQGLM